MALNKPGPRMATITTASRRLGSDSMMSIAREVVEEYGNKGIKVGLVNET